MFEVQDLRYATLATVSRCGMVWFSEDVLSTQMIFDNFLMTLRNVPIEATEDDVKNMAASSGTDEPVEQVSPTLSVSSPRCHLLSKIIEEPPHDVLTNSILPKTTDSYIYYYMPSSVSNAVEF